jgi:hypothetical protein
LIAGAGGGFDVYAGLPLALALRRAGKQVFLANLTFTYLGETDAIYVAPHVAAVTTATTGADRYFPERRLAEWLAEHDQPTTIYTFEKVGVVPLRTAYTQMAIYFAFELAAVAKQSLYLHLQEDTDSVFDVGARIRAFRNTVQPRPRVPIPH